MKKFRTALLVAAATLAWAPAIVSAQPPEQQDRHGDRPGGRDRGVDTGVQPQREATMPMPIQQQRPQQIERRAPDPQPAAAQQQQRRDPAPLAAQQNGQAYGAGNRRGALDQRGQTFDPGQGFARGQQGQFTPGIDRRTDNRAFGGRQPGGIEADRRGQDGRGYDNRTANGRAYGSRGGYDNRGYDNRSFNGRGSDNRFAQNWRNDRRYDWQGWRTQNRQLFHAPRYYPPRGYGFGYRPFTRGLLLEPFFYDRSYWIDDPWEYRLPPADGPYRWVRYYDDVLLVDIATGEVVDVIQNFFW